MNVELRHPCSQAAYFSEAFELRRLANVVPATNNHHYFDQVYRPWTTHFAYFDWPPWTYCVGQGGTVAVVDAAVVVGTYC